MLVSNARVMDKSTFSVRDVNMFQRFDHDWPGDPRRIILTHPQFSLRCVSFRNMLPSLGLGVPTAPKER